MHVNVLTVHCLTNSPKPKDSSFTIVNNKEKQHVLMFKKLEPGHVGHFCLKNVMEVEINGNRINTCHRPHTVRLSGLLSAKLTGIS